jgi:O-acetyl-ADP-ribose deacetylase (regulator of RNase III)
VLPSCSIHINHVLQALKKEIQAEHLLSLALPRLAMGVGGLSWTEVRPLIAHALGDGGIPVYVYTTFKKGIAAVESP